MVLSAFASWIGAAGGPASRIGGGARFPTVNVIVVTLVVCLVDVAVVVEGAVVEVAGGPTRLPTTVKALDVCVVDVVSAGHAALVEDVKSADPEFVRQAIIAHVHFSKAALADAVHSAGAQRETD